MEEEPLNTTAETPIEDEKPVSFKEGIAGIWRHVRPDKASVIILIVLGIISAIANGFVPYVTGEFFDALIAVSQHQGKTGLLAPWVIFLAAWALAQLIANNVDWVSDRIRRTVSNTVHFRIQSEGFVHLFKLPLSYHANAPINSTLSQINMTSWRVSNILQSVIQIAPQLLSLTIGIVLAASINLTLAGILTLGVLVYVLLLVRMLRTIATADDKAHNFWNESWNDASAAVLQVTSVKESAAETYEIEKTRKALMVDAKRMWGRLERTWSNIGFFQRTIVFFTQLAIFIVSVQLVTNGSITVGQLIALNGYALMFFGPFVQLGYSWQVMQNGLTAAGSMERVFLEDEEQYAPKDTQVPPVRNGEVVYDHVSFKYDLKDAAVLKDISFAAHKGETVAFVGESGAGKSTILSLLSGYYFPTGGKVLIEGVETGHWDLTELRRRIAIVPQEVALFNESIRTNIRYGTFDATDEQVEAAAKEAHIHDYVTSLPNGYDTLVGERGVKLSVGQKQRIAIARAMLRDPEILILDEPTSALDAETEKYITQSLEKLMEDRTTFIIAHRLSTVRQADMILVLKEGTIAERGSHDELIQIPNGQYRRLYNLHVGLHE